MTSTIRRTVVGAAVAATICVSAAAFGQAGRPQLPQLLAVAGAANATTALAASDHFVAAVWTATKEGATNVYLATSEDGGASFSAPRRVNDLAGDASANNEQPPRVVVSGSGAARRLTVLWSKRGEDAQKRRKDSIRVARSTDGGRTFSAAGFVHDAGLSGARGWESLAAGPDGVVHAVWLDGRDAERKMAGEAAHSGVAHKGQPPQDIYHAVIASDGRTTQNLIATGVCFCCKTAVAVDERGAVYAAWRHIFPGSMRDIAFARSVNGGRHFDTAVRVSDDNWELNGCPEDGPTIAVDRSGLIHIAWATVVNDANPQKAVFYATSRDAKTFSPRVRVPAAADVTPGHPQLALTPSGGAVIVWDELVAGVRRVSFARVSRAGVFQPSQVLSGDEAASHPVIVRSGENLVIAWTSRSPAAKSSSEPSSIRLRRISIG
jgi:hypothetical protein